VQAQAVVSSLFRTDEAQGEREEAPEELLGLTDRWIYGCREGNTIFLGRRLFASPPGEAVKTIVHETIHIALNEIRETGDAAHLGFHAILPIIYPELLHSFTFRDRITLFLNELWHRSGSWESLASSVLQVLARPRSR